MPAGRRKEKVAFDAPVRERNRYGGEETAWSEQFVTSAEFIYLRGGETVQAARLEGRQPVVVRILASTASREITTGWRMRDLRRSKMDPDTGKAISGVFSISTAFETEDRKHIEITAIRGGAT